MPRLPRQLLAKAWTENPLLPLLLRSCRDIDSARCELRWLKDHAIASSGKSGSNSTYWVPLLKKYCHERSLGRPLQYILGSEFFGSLKLTCRPGVLIPRQDTANLIHRLLNRVNLGKDALLFPSKTLSILDLCTGTGCIPLLFAKSFRFLQAGEESKRTLGTDILPQFLKLVGVDISPEAIALAKHNQAKALQQLDMDSKMYKRRHSALSNTKFLQANILPHRKGLDGGQAMDLISSLEKNEHGTQWDIIISNPPYISPKAFYQTTSRSVRNYEPTLALVPPKDSTCFTDEQQGDLFYPRLLHLAEEFGTKILLMEVADLTQAERVAMLAVQSRKWEKVEIWCDESRREDSWGGDHAVISDDDPWCRQRFNQKPEQRILNGIPLIGQGEGRGVYCRRGGQKPALDTDRS